MKKDVPKPVHVWLVMMKAMQAEGLGWGEDLRPLARRALTEVIEDRMHESIDAHLLRVAERGEADRRSDIPLTDRSKSRW